MTYNRVRVMQGFLHGAERLRRASTTITDVALAQACADKARVCLGYYAQMQAEPDYWPPKEELDKAIRS